MASRLKLQGELEKILGNRNVYFQPPESIRLSYPCIIYNLSRDRSFHADNKVYLNKKQYDVMVIDRNPDSELPDLLRDSIPLTSLERTYVKDNLHHFVYNLYY